MKNRTYHRLLPLVLVAFIIPSFFLIAGIVWAQAKTEKSKFTAVVTDSQGVETELKHVIFYWEEKVSETSFVPHELVHMPVKQGTATVNVKFDRIKQIEVKPGANDGSPVFSITLTTGKTGDFTSAVKGSFKGETEFGEVELPAGSLKKVAFK